MFFQTYFLTVNNMFRLYSTHSFSKILFTTFLHQIKIPPLLDFNDKSIHMTTLFIVIKTLPYLMKELKMVYPSAII